MARIFDNIDEKLLTTLRATLEVSNRADFCVGYLNLRGWQAIDDLVESWSPADGQVCRLLVGMQRPQRDDIRELYGLATEQQGIDNSLAVELKNKFAAELREQITIGIPTGADERGMRRFARQLMSKARLTPAMSNVSSTQTASRIDRSLAAAESNAFDVTSARFLRLSLSHH